MDPALSPLCRTLAITLPLPSLHSLHHTSLSPPSLSFSLSASLPLLPPPSLSLIPPPAPPRPSLSLSQPLFLCYHLPLSLPLSHSICLTSSFGLIPLYPV